jgi:hypothetical protein
MPITRWSPERVIAPVKAGFKPAAEGLEKVAQGLAPRGKTGQLAAHTTVTITGETSGILHVPGVPYAGAVIGGAKPHEIDPKNAEALTIGRVGEGFAAVVHHPGNKPNHYLQEAAPSFKPLYVNAVRSFMHLGF